MTSDLNSNWMSFQAEFEDYVFTTGLNDKDAEVQAATPRRLMGNECRLMGNECQQPGTHASPREGRGGHTGGARAIFHTC